MVCTLQSLGLNTVQEATVRINRLFILFVALALASSALASDGVLEINQACAQAGCFSGDAPGLPVTIDRDQPASYRLTSSLFNEDPDTSGIEIRDDHVSLDLNGFSINGPATCSGRPLTCTNTGAGSGITTDVARVGINVRSGIIRGSGSAGLSLGAEAHVEDVLAVSNGAIGILVGGSSVVQKSRAVRNGSTGIEVGAFSVVSEDVASENAGWGISGSGGSSILSCTSNRNGGVGIAGTLGMTIRNNSVTENGADGIFVEFVFEAASAITGNSIANNGGDGVQAGSGATVLDNAVYSNSNFGLNLGTSAGYSNNVVRNNTGGEITGGIQIGTNLCGANTTCP